jgi:acyl-CoA synthetase (AMP-forming)/AMP-acid ligase II
MSAEVPEFDRIGEYVAFHAETRPKAEALSCDEFRLDYRQVRGEVDRYARALEKSGIGRGHVVAVLGNSRPECFLAFMACCRIGAVFLGLNPKHNVRELGQVLADSRPRLVLSMHGPEQPEQNEKLWALRPEISSIQEIVTRSGARPGQSVSLQEFISDSSGPVNAQYVSADDPCAIVYTSGSTGAPKGALLSQRGMMRSARLTWRYWYAARADLRTVAQHPINHVGWLVCECVTLLVAGGSVYFRERFDGGGTLRLIERERLNLWIAFPSMAILAMNSLEFETCDLSSLERLALGSLPSVDVLARLRRRTRAVFSITYGLTEANGGALTVTDDAADLESLTGTIGRPLPGVDLRIVDPDGQEVPDGSSGELLVRDPCLFLGYLNRPEATALALDPKGWLHTGDAVAKGTDGNLQLVGRLKEMFKSGGYNVYPTEIETVIASHSGVGEVAVVEAPDQLWTEVGLAFVVPKTGGTLTAGELTEYCRARLANYKVPKRFEIVANLPQLANGKFDKVELRERARRLVENGTPHRI